MTFVTVVGKRKEDLMIAKSVLFFMVFSQHFLWVLCLLSALLHAYQKCSKVWVLWRVCKKTQILWKMLCKIPDICKHWYQLWVTTTTQSPINSSNRNRMLRLCKQQRVETSLSNLLIAIAVRETKGGVIFDILLLAPLPINWSSTQKKRRINKI